MIMALEPPCLSSAASPTPAIGTLTGRANAPSSLERFGSIGGPHARGLALDAQLLGDQEQGPPLDLLVHPTEVLADYAERDELHAGEEHHGDDERRKARYVGAEQQGLHQEHHGIAEGEERDHQPEIGPHPEWNGRERGDPIEGEAQQAARGPARAATTVTR